MGKQPAASQAGGGGEARSRARGASGTAPSTTRGAAPQPQPQPAAAARHRDESAHGVRHAVAPRDGGAGTSAAVQGAPLDQSIRFVSHGKEVRFGGEKRPSEPSPVHGDAGKEASARTPQRMPSYMPAWKRKEGLEQTPHAAQPRPASDHRRPIPAPFEERQATPVEPRRQGWPKLTSQKTIERISTLRDDDGGTFQGQPPAGGSWTATQPPHDPRHERPAQHPPTSSPLNEPYYAPPTQPPGALPPRKSRMVLNPEQKKVQRPMAFCFTACCILFWLLVIAVGVAVLVVFLLYHPKSPRLRVTSATLNAGYIDELGGGGGGSGARALNADLTVLAAIYNPNTKIHIVLRYMQLDLYFEGSMIATQAVWPVPLHEGPGGNVLRNVHLAVSEVTMTQEDVFVWQNATTKGGPVVLQLAGRFHTQLNFGHWFRYQYWVTPRCTLVLDPPPSGALRRAWC
ncbi:hypothetical protein ABZP36_016253 [Zizania latifolia]